jgi:hypothetical protein
MIVLPIIFCSAFFASLYALFQKQERGIFIFLIFGLPIYTISLSICYQYGLTKFIPALQTSKEVIVVAYLVYAIAKLKATTTWTSIDKLVFAFLGVNIIYACIPFGSYSFFERLVALKSLSFFPVVYFTGRLMNKDAFQLNKVFTFIGVLTMIISGVLLVELITYTHIQSITGYASFNQHFFDQDTTGNYGLSWTFEIENGMKRFASLFSTPLELGAATIIALAASLALITTLDNKIRSSKFTNAMILASFFCIVFALSRASFVGFCVMLYVYAWLTHKKVFLKIIHILIAVGVTAFLIVSFNNDFVEFIVTTLDFSNPSSLGHLLEWINGIESIVNFPLGIGLGNAGRVSGFSGYNVGGENQLIIIGVQTGIVTLLLYVTTYYIVIKKAYNLFKYQTGRIRRLALFILLVKIGLIIPLLTSETESYIYISYLTWILTGLLVNMSSQLKLSTK